MISPRQQRQFSFCGVEGGGGGVLEIFLRLASPDTQRVKMPNKWPLKASCYGSEYGGQLSPKSVPNGDNAGFVDEKRYSSSNTAPG